MSDDARPQGDGVAQPDDHATPYHAEWNEADCVSSTIVRTVAAVSNTEPTALEPIYDVVDPDALEAVVTSLRETGDGVVTFDYAGYTIEIQGTGHLTIWPQGELRKRSTEGI